MSGFGRWCVATYNQVFPRFESLDNLLLLGARAAAAYYFVVMAVDAIQQWNKTLILYQFEYSVPLLSSESAAILFTTIQLAAGIFLAMGLATRKAALLLTLVNGFIIASYDDFSLATLYEPYFVQTLLLIGLVWGAGALSVDRLVGMK